LYSARRRLDKVVDQELRETGRFLAMTINQSTHRLVKVLARSYLTDPQDAVTIQAEFAELPDGTNHVATAEIDSVNRHLNGEIDKLVLSMISISGDITLLEPSHTARVGTSRASL